MAQDNVCHFTHVQGGIPGWVNTESLLQRWVDAWFGSCFQFLCRVPNTVSVKLWLKSPSVQPQELHVELLHPILFSRSAPWCHGIEVDFIACLICTICLFFLPLLHLSSLVQDDPYQWQLIRISEPPKLPKCLAHRSHALSLPDLTSHFHQPYALIIHACL